MEFSHDLWIEIKMYMFHRHLWNVKKYEVFTKVLRSVPKYGTNPTVINHTNSLIVASSKNVDKYVKIYECLSWQNHIINLISHVLILKSKFNYSCALDSSSSYYDVITC